MIELADAAGALPRTAGVRIIYQATDAFGFDQAGVGLRPGAVQGRLMADAEWKKAELWADTGDREDPEDVGIDRSVGWTVSYEQRGSGDEPERTVFNQLLRELSGLYVMVREYGGPRDPVG